MRMRQLQGRSSAESPKCCAARPVARIPVCVRLAPHTVGLAAQQHCGTPLAFRTFSRIQTHRLAGWLRCFSHVAMSAQLTVLSRSGSRYARSRRDMSELRIRDGTRKASDLLSRLASVAQL